MKFLIYLLFFISIPCYAGTVIDGATITGINMSNRKILPIGDSITEGDTSGDPYWRNNLQDVLGIGVYDFVGDRRSPTTSAYYRYDMEHAGVGGMQTTAMLARVPSLLSNYLTTGADFSNSFVLLHAGTNDCFQYSCEVSTTALDNIEDMVDLVMAYNSQLKIIVALIIPSNIVPPNDYQNVRIQNFIPLLRTRLQALQVTYPNRVIIADMNGLFLDTSNCLPDLSNCLDPDFGVHPYSVGQQLMADQWKRCMDSPTNQGCNGN